MLSSLRNRVTVSFASASSSAAWLKPRVVAQIRFVEWTAEGHLRHAAFLGLRSDKRPAVVVRE